MANAAKKEPKPPVKHIECLGFKLRYQGIHDFWKESALRNIHGNAIESFLYPCRGFHYFFESNEVPFSITIFVTEGSSPTAAYVCKWVVKGNAGSVLLHGEDKGIEATVSKIESEILDRINFYEWASKWQAKGRWEHGAL